MLVEQLAAKQFEDELSLIQSVFYTTERAVCNLLLKRSPPSMQGDSLLNLGCGPKIFPGWVNADDYAIKRYFRQRQFRPNWRLDITRPWRCPDGRWDGVFTEHVLEMITYSKAVFALRECFRTMKSGAWIRVSLPDLNKYLALYEGRVPAGDFPDFPHPVVAISFLTQMHFHKSTWSADLMIRVLTEIGFCDATERAFREGIDSRLVKDDEDKAKGSFYVEARKP